MASEALGKAMGLEGREALVVGLGRSGVAAAAFLARHGARVLAADRQPMEALSEEARALPSLGVRLETGPHRPASFTGSSLVVVSPGVPWDLPELVAAREAGARVIAELELGWGELLGTVAAVTGTKGKSTTTAALGAMLGEAGLEVRVGGNIGRPLVGLVEGATEATFFVVEVSSFQLEGIEGFHPRVAVFLNLSPDHLDRHPTFEDYAKAKARVFLNQTADDWAVVRADDPEVRRLAASGSARAVAFLPREGNAAQARALLPAASATAFFRQGRAVLERDGAEEELFRRADVRLPGAHLAGDLLAAAAAARLLGAPAEAVARAVEGFSGVEHVLERVAEVRGVEFFNDSKATNVDAVRVSLEAFDRPLLPILGGRYKGGDFSLLRDLARGRCRAVLAIGEAAPRVAEALEPVVSVRRCPSLEAAVEQGYAEAKPGDVVLLAPGCSSFDMFADYAERGRAFKDAVRALAVRAGVA